MERKVITLASCIIFGMFLTPVYIENSHGAIAGQSQYQLCILGINK